MNFDLHVNGLRETTHSDDDEAFVKGDRTLIDQIVVGNVRSIQVNSDFGDYEENIDGRFVVQLNDGKVIVVDGYNGMWEILSYDKLNDNAKDELINNFRLWAKDIVKDIDDEIV